MTPNHSSYSNGQQQHPHQMGGGNGTYFPTPRSPYLEMNGNSLAKGLNGGPDHQQSSSAGRGGQGGERNGIVTRDVAQSVLKNPSGHGHGSSNGGFGDMNSNQSVSSSSSSPRADSSSVDPSAASADRKSNGNEYEAQDEANSSEPPPITFASISSYDATNTPLPPSTPSVASSSQRSASPFAPSSDSSSKNNNDKTSSSISSSAPPPPSSPLSLPHQDTTVSSPGSTHASLLSSPSPAPATSAPPPPVSWADDDREMDSA
jgi:hypothetical protein